MGEQYSLGRGELVGEAGLVELGAVLAVGLDLPLHGAAGLIGLDVLRRFQVQDRAVVVMKRGAWSVPYP